LVKISATIITLNEEANLDRCLRSVVSVVDEVIVLDSGSTDRTRPIALSHGAQFFERTWSGYVDQKNHAIGLARHEWILSLDADEELSGGLKQEILDLKKRPEGSLPDGFSIPRVVYFQDRWIRFGDWYPDRLVRLFRKGRGRFEGGAVHERLHLEGTTSKLRNEIHHYTYKDREDQLQRIERYSTLWAETAYSEGRRAGRWSPQIHAGWRLFRAFILKHGWKGGRLGWQIACANAYEVLLKYEKLHQLGRGR
jgi:glycosyltransferase involved in cell wall biosynthesis